MGAVGERKVEKGRLLGGSSAGKKQRAATGRGAVEETRQGAGAEEEEKRESDSRGAEEGEAICWGGSAGGG